MVDLSGGAWAFGPGHTRMSGAGFIPTLLQARDAGVVLRADGGELTVSPASRVPIGLGIAIDALRSELVKILTWDKATAEGIVLDGLSELDEYYVTGEPYATLGDKLDALQAPNARISEAFAWRDMHLLRVTVHMWVQAGINAYRDWTEGVSEGGP